jgi:preprotein translocase subunit SecG
MVYLFAALIFIVSLVLVLLVIIQRSKGGGLATNLQGGAALAQQMGMRKATDFVEKATWYSMGGIALLAILANIAIASSAGDVPETDTPRSVEAARRAAAAPTAMPQMQVPEGVLDQPATPAEEQQP